MKKSMMLGCLLTWAICGVASAQEIELPDTPPTDRYDWAERYGMGALELWQTASGLEGAIFNINTVSERGNICDAAGVIHQQKSVLQTPNGACELHFTPNQNRIQVKSSSPQMCTYFCGSGVYFEGDYLKMPAECSDTAKRKTDQLFNRQYRAKQYAQAVSTLRQMWQTCAPTMHWLEEMSIRNNLAVTYAKMGDKDQCSKILQPYKKEIVSKNPMEERDPPVTYVFEEEYKVQLKNARYNWKLCQ